MDNKPYLLTRSVQGLLVAKHANPQVELTIVGVSTRLIGLNVNDRV